MMRATATLVALIAAALAALCAASDGALLTVVEQPTTPDGNTLPHGHHRDVTHRALGIMRAIAQVVAGASGALALDLPARPMRESLPLALLLAILLVALAELAPRAAGDARGRALLDALAPFIGVVEMLMGPFVGGGAAVDGVLRRLLPPTKPGESDRDAAAEQFRQVVRADAGEPPPSEQRAIVHRVFSLGDTEVQDVMVPRVDIVGVERATPWSEVVDRVRSAQHARLPVYDDTLDEIVGILYAKDLLAPAIAGEEPSGGWLTLVRPAMFIPEGKAIDAQLRDFKASRTHIAIVVDEYGGTAGLLTIEDILEEIVGDIRDEYDREEPPIETENGTRFWVLGRVTLDDLSEALGHRFEHEDVTTVGGLIFQQLGRVPKAGEQLLLDGFRVVVERVVRRRVDRVYFERLEPAERPV